MRPGSSVAREVGPDVEIPGARPAAQPLHRSADRELGAEPGNVERHGSRRLVDVEDHVRADLLRLLDHRPRVLDVRTAEQHERERDEHRLLVDGVEQPFEIRPHRVVRRT